jgi:hypothetical protein
VLNGWLAISPESRLAIAAASIDLLSLLARVYLRQRPSDEKTLALTRAFLNSNATHSVHLHQFNYASPTLGILPLAWMSNRSATLRNIFSAKKKCGQIIHYSVLL